MSTDTEALRRLAEESLEVSEKATEGPWELTPNGAIKAWLEPPEDVPGVHAIGEMAYQRDGELAIFFRTALPTLAQAILDLTKEPSEDSKRLEKLEALHSAVLRWSIHSNSSIIRQKEEVILDKLAALSPNLRTHD